MKPRAALLIGGGHSNWTTWVRHVHRRMSIVFTAVVIVSIVAMAQGQPATWVGLLALLALVLLLLTRLYVFAPPDAAKRRGARPVTERST